MNNYSQEADEIRNTVPVVRGLDESIRKFQDGVFKRHLKGIDQVDNKI